MWQRLERQISFLNCLFVYFVIFFFLPSTFLVFLLLTFFGYPHFFFHPHFSIRIFPSASAIRRYLVRDLQTPVTKKFLEVSRCSGAKQWQKMYKKKRAVRAKLLFLLIRPIVIFHLSPALPSRLALHDFIFCLNKPGADLGEGAGGAHPPWDDQRFSNTSGILQKKKKTMCRIGVEVEQETSAPPPKKNSVYASANYKYYRELRF